MRIAIIRGANLNKWEMQNYEPLLKKHEVVAYTTNESKFDLGEIEIPVRRLPLYEEAGYLECIAGLEEELRGFDIAYTLDTLYGYSYQAIFAKERYGIKVAVCCTENIPFNYEDNPMNAGLSSYAKRDEIRERVREGADLFIALTERAKEALAFEGVSGDKIRVIPWGIDTDFFRPSDGKSEDLMKLFGIKESERVILYNGRYDWHRGVYDLIYAAKSLLDDQRLENFSLKFLFIGSRGEIEGMRWLVSRLGLEKNVIIFDNYPHKFRYEELPMIYNLADIFCFPSIPTRFIKEQFGVVLLEAMACGVPVISTLCGSIPEVVGDAGVLVQPNDSSSLSQELKRLIEDDSLHREMEMRGQQRVRELFDSRKIAEVIEEVFRIM